jgi:xylulokinase
LGAPLVTTKTAEGAAQGAAILAGVGAGWWPSVEDACSEIVEVGDPVEPSHEADHYGELYERYREMYPILAPTFHALAE